ncbi:MAG: MATE family efflux transporter [Myxococcales bacterium]|nr:MATE family efflux transporter [Myxococcales bacterium]
MDLGRTKTIIALALPIVGGMISQNVLNLVDTAMVGTLGAAALGAVGMASFATFMSQAFIMALGAGVQAMAARRMGEGKGDEMAVPLNGGLVLALVLGIPVAILMWFLSPAIFDFLSSDPEVAEIGIPYWKARIFALVAVGMNFSFRGYWNGVNRSGLYLRTLLVMHAVNIFLNWVLIFGKLGMPALGATGAGIGTTISLWVGTLYYIYLGRRYAKDAGFLRGLPSLQTLRGMLRLSVPSGIQQLFFAAGMTALAWIVGKVGTDELGAVNVLLNVTMVALLPGIGLGLVAASLVGQALGRGEPDEARRWGWDVAQVGVLLLGALGLPMLLVPELILDAFIKERHVIELAAPALQVSGATIAAEGLGMVLLNALIGAGDTRRVMVVSVSMQWLLFLPAAFVIGPVLGYGLLGIWLANAAYRGVQAVIFAGLWRGGKWATIKI